LSRRSSIDGRLRSSAQLQIPQRTLVRPEGRAAPWRCPPAGIEPAPLSEPDFEPALHGHAFFRRVGNNPKQRDNTNT
jgi:hypothetical protein